MNSIKRTINKSFITIVLIIAALVSVPIWLKGDNTWQWEEEVELNDGTKIWIDRKEIREAKGSSDLSQGVLKGTKSTQIRIPNGTNPILWESSLAPIVVDKGVPPVEWTVIATPVWCDHYRQLGSPWPPYIQFNYMSGKWHQRAVSKEWDKRRSNLLQSEQQISLNDGKSVTSETIKEFNKPVQKVAERYLAVDFNQSTNCN